MNAVTVRNLTKSFSSAQVLRGIDLTVPTESLTAILGPSGCGKTTLLRLIAGFDVPDSGEILLGEQVVCGGGQFVAPQRRRVGYVPQEGALFPHLTVADNITFGLLGRERRDSRGGRGGRGDDRVEELLTLVGLDPAVRLRYPHQLSGGQQQRVALARALAPRPSLILLDEPFSSLDAGLREGTGRAVVQALKATGTTAILVTHDQSEALSLADQVAVMREGALAQVGTPHEVYCAPADLGVAEFVGAAVVVEAVIVDGVASSDLGPLYVAAGSNTGDGLPDSRDVPDSDGSRDSDGSDGSDGSGGSERVQLLVRPEQIELADPSMTGLAELAAGSVAGDVAGAAGGVAARVLDVSYFGHDAAVHLLVLASGRLVTARVLGRSVPLPGSLVHLSVTGPVAAYSPEGGALPADYGRSRDSRSPMPSPLS